MAFESGIDIVVTNYRTPGDLQAFCWSVFDYAPSVPWTLVIANVCPQADDVDVGDWAVRAAGAAKNVVHHCHAENVGYGRACNSGGSRGKYSTLALFNADVRLTPGALDQCHWALERHEDWGVVGPRQIDDMGLLTHAGIFGTEQAPELRAWHRPDHPNFADVQPAVSVSGSAYFIKRPLWDELTRCPLYRQVSAAEGAFLPTPHYYEETFCSYHARAHGWQVVYYGLVGIVHHWHQASPVGGWAEQQMPVSQALFRSACDAHNIAHD